MRTVRRLAACLIVALALTVSWLAQASSCRLPWNLYQAWSDARTVYDQSAGLRYLSQTLKDPTAANVQAAWEAVSRGAYEKYGLRFQFVPDDANIPGTKLTSDNPASWNPNDNTIYFRASLKNDPVRLARQIQHEYGAYLLGRYYFPKYIAQLAQERGAPIPEQEINQLWISTGHGKYLIPTNPGAGFGVTYLLDSIAKSGGEVPPGLLAPP